MLRLEQLLRVRSAYAGRFDADGGRLLVISDLAGVPQVWAVNNQYCPEGREARENPAGKETSEDQEGRDTWEPEGNREAWGRQEWPELLVTPPDRAQTIHPGPCTGQLIVGADVGGDERTQLLLVGDGGRSSGRGGLLREGLAGPWRPLTDDPEHIYQFGGWAPDGESVVYASNTRTGRWFDIHVRDLSAGEARCILQDDSTNYAGPVSPDGRWVVVSRVFSNAHHELWLVDLGGSQAPRLLTPPGVEARFERPQWTPDGGAIICRSDLNRELVAPTMLDISTGSITFLLEPAWEVDDAALAPDGRRLAYAVNRDSAAEVIVRDMQTGGEQRVEGLPHGALHDYWQPGLAWDSTSTRLAISWSASRHAPNVWIHDARSGRIRQASHAPQCGVEPSQLSEPEHVSYPTFDGRRIPALFFPPKRRHNGAPPPCVVFVHGGPESQFRPSFQPLVQYLVSAGLAVLAPNVRGSTGYGKTYVHLDDVRLRMDSVADLAHAAYWLRDSGRADPARVAVYGGSYGGFMVLAALATYPDLWAAGVDVVGIANFVTFLENTGPWRRHLREAEYGNLERDREFLESISPINHVDRIRAPLLVIHGANDPRVPIGEAEQIVARLRSLGRTVELLRLDDEGHQISKLKNKLVAYPLAEDFLKRHLRATAA